MSGYLDKGTKREGEVRRRSPQWESGRVPVREARERELLVREGRVPLLDAPVGSRPEQRVKDAPSGSGGVGSFRELSDVSFTGVKDGQVFAYSATLDRLVPITLPAVQGAIPLSWGDPLTPPSQMPLTYSSTSGTSYANYFRFTHGDFSETLVPGPAIFYYYRNSGSPTLRHRPLAGGGSDSPPWTFSTETPFRAVWFDGHWWLSLKATTANGYSQVRRLDGWGVYNDGEFGNPLDEGHQYGFESFYATGGFLWSLRRTDGDPNAQNGTLIRWDNATSGYEVTAPSFDKIQKIWANNGVIWALGRTIDDGVGWRLAASSGGWFRNMTAGAYQSFTRTSIADVTPFGELAVVVNSSSYSVAVRMVQTDFERRVYNQLFPTGAANGHPLDIASICALPDGRVMLGGRIREDVVDPVAGQNTRVRAAIWIFDPAEDPAVARAALIWYGNYSYQPGSFGSGDGAVVSISVPQMPGAEGLVEWSVTVPNGSFVRYYYSQIPPAGP